ncbi:MAG: class I SAM-dependent RNA methyltransferase [Spirochaetia bacterium]|nr:class I SAM-dependent RNA methyltransferase [Spirochaetia bacterium]
MKENLVSLTIEKVVAKGEGLAREGNKIWFVPFTLAHEKVLATAITIKKQFIRGELVEIIEASVDRVDPFCPYYGVCGGCDFQHVSYPKEVKIKEEIIVENLKRIGNIELNQEHLLPSITGNNLGYRARVRFSVDQKEGKIGFLARSSHDVVDITSCPLLTPSLNELLSVKRNILLDMAKEIDPFKSHPFLNIPAFEGDYGEVTLDENEVKVSLLSTQLFVNAHLFFQSNKEMLTKMAHVVKDWCIGETIVDLYSGIGTFASVIEGDNKRVFAVERDKKCLSLALKHLKFTTFITQDASSWIASLKKAKIDTLIVDPPRTGLESSMIKDIDRMNPTHFIYISCDSATFSRDAALLKKVGYIIDKFIFVDMYPHTSHTETMALFKRC